jgi:predicted alpha/beta-fold hydrolase
MLAVVLVYALVFALTIYILWFTTSEGSALFFCFKATPENEELVGLLRQHPYQKPWWYNSHLASIVEFGSYQSVRYRHEILRQEDGTEFEINHASLDGEGNEQAERVCIVLGGLGGGMEKPFLKAVSHEMLLAGFRVICVPLRGHPPWLGHRLTTSKPFQAADCSDLKHLIEHLWPEALLLSPRIFAIGFSAGSATITTYLSNTGTHSRLSAAMTVCNGFHYKDVISTLEGAGMLGWLYSYSMCCYLRGYYAANARALEHYDAASVQQTNVLTELDARTFQTHGYKSVEEYWDSNDLRAGLSNIAVPLVALQPADDPLFSGHTRSFMPLVEIKKNRNIVYMETAGGGHCGYVSGSVLRSFSETNRTIYKYPARVALAFFDEVAKRTGAAANSGSAAPCT